MVAWMNGTRFNGKERTVDQSISREHGNQTITQLKLELEEHHRIWARITLWACSEWDNL